MSIMWICNVAIYVLLRDDLHSSNFYFCGTWISDKNTISGAIFYDKSLVKDSYASISHNSVTIIVLLKDSVKIYTIETRLWFIGKFSVGGHIYDRMYIGYNIEKGMRCIVYLNDNQIKKKTICCSVYSFRDVYDVLSNNTQLYYYSTLNRHP